MRFLLQAMCRGDRILPEQIWQLSMPKQILKEKGKMAEELFTLAKFGFLKQFDTLPNIDI